MTLVDGCTVVSDKVGLGVELKEEEALRHPYQPCPFRHYSGALTDIRPPDAVPFFRVIV